MLLTVQGECAKVRLNNLVLIQHMWANNSFNGEIYLKICLVVGLIPKMPQKSNSMLFMVTFFFIQIVKMHVDPNFQTNKAMILITKWTLSGPGSLKQLRNIFLHSHQWFSCLNLCILVKRAIKSSVYCWNFVCLEIWVFLARWTRRSRWRVTRPIARSSTSTTIPWHVEKNL